MPNDPTNAGWKKWSLPVRIGIAIIACLLIAKDLKWNGLKGAFEDLRLWIFMVSIFVFSASQYLVGLRWWLFLRAQQITIPLTTAVKLNFLGLFFSNFLPSSIGGDLVRAWYVSRYSSRKLQAALGVLVDRFMGLLSTLLIALAGIVLFMRHAQLLTFRRTESPLHFLKSVSPSHLALIALITVGILLIFKSPIQSIALRLWRHIIHLFGQLHQVVGVYYRHPFVLVWALILTVFLQSIVITAYWLVGRDLNIDAPLGYYFVFFPLVWVIGAIPVSIAGLGILEGGLVFLFVRYAGATIEAAVALALCQRLTWLAASLPGLYVHLTGSYRHTANPTAVA